MEEQCYNICMQTPIGAKYGTMEFTVIGEEISGYFNLMNHCEPFTGTIDEYGYCHITGHIVTLLRNIRIEACGRIFNGSMELCVKGERNMFEITGMLCERGVKQEV